LSLFYAIFFDYTKSLMPNPYFRFLNLLRAIDEPFVFDKDQGNMQLLEAICSHKKLNDKYFTVNEVLLLKTLGSQATLHKRVHKLAYAGLVTLEVQGDARVKHVVPTSHALKLFRQIDKLLINAAST